MTDKPLSPQRQLFVNEYCTNGYNNTQAYNVAYPNSPKAAHCTNAARLIGVDCVKQAIDKKIQEISRKREVKADYNYEKAIKEVDWLINGLITQVDSGNISAKSLYLQAVKEKAELTGLHKQRFIDETAIPTELSELERARLRKQARTAMTEVV